MAASTAKARQAACMMRQGELFTNQVPGRTAWIALWDICYIHGIFFFGIYGIYKIARIYIYIYGISNDIILSGWITLQLFQTWLAGKSPINGYLNGNIIYPLVNKHNFWKWQFIVDLPIKIVIFHSYVSLPEGINNGLSTATSDYRTAGFVYKDLTATEPWKFWELGLRESSRSGQTHSSRFWLLRCFTLW